MKFSKPTYLVLLIFVIILSSCIHDIQVKEETNTLRETRKFDSYRINNLLETRYFDTYDLGSFDLKEIENLSTTTLITNKNRIEKYLKYSGFEWKIVSLRKYSNVRVNTKCLLNRRIYFYVNERLKVKSYATFPFYTTDYGIHSITQKSGGIEIRLTLGDDRKNVIVSKSSRWTVKKLLIDKRNSSVKVIAVMENLHHENIVLSSVDESDIKLKFVNSKIIAKRKERLFKLSMPDYIHYFPLPQKMKKIIFRNYYKFEN